MGTVRYGSLATVCVYCTGADHGDCSVVEYGTGVGLGYCTVVGYNGDTVL